MDTEKEMQYARIIYAQSTELFSDDTDYGARIGLAELEKA